MSLYHCADFCAEKLIQHTNTPSSHKPVFRYGIELTISTLSSILSVLFLSLLLNATIETIVFLIAYMSLRIWSGGYHAKTYARCFLSTNLTYLAVYAISRILLTLESVWPPLILLFAANIVIFTWAPVKNKNHPLSEKRYQQNKKIARIRLFVYNLVFVVFFIFLNKLIFIFSVSGAAVAALMIIPMLKQWREKDV